MVVVGMVTTGRLAFDVGICWEGRRVDRRISALVVVGMVTTGRLAFDVGVCWEGRRVDRRLSALVVVGMVTTERLGVGRRIHGKGVFLWWRISYLRSFGGDVLLRCSERREAVVVSFPGFLEVVRVGC